MTVALSLGSYLEFLSKEYLGDFIRDGGASVKFLVSPDPTAIERAHAGLAEAAAAEGYVYARIDAAVTKVHQIDQLFFALARQADWEALDARLVHGPLAGADRARGPDPRPRHRPPAREPAPSGRRT